MTAPKLGVLSYIQYADLPEVYFAENKIQTRDSDQKTLAHFSTPYVAKVEVSHSMR